MEHLKLILDKDVVDRYNEYYFQRHPKAKKKAIAHSFHPSINSWMILPRIQMNALKQKWKEFIVFWIRELGFENLHLERFEMIFTAYMPTKRRVDCDNTVPKFILDGFVQSGFIVDDDCRHLEALTLKAGYDKDNPRTEITVIVKE